MGAVEVAVRGDHLRLDPQAEFHAQLFNAVGKFLKPAGQLFEIDVIVAQPRRIAVARAEPAVIEDEKLNAEAFCSFSKLQELFAVKFEKAGLPVVYEHRAFDVFPCAAHDVIVDEVVEIRTQAVEAPIGKGHDRLGRFKALARARDPVKAVRIYAELDADEIVVRSFHHAAVVAAVDKIKAPGTAEVLVRVLFREQEARIMPV